MVRLGNPDDASHASASLRPTARDFELLGIRLDEARLGVIRRAARQAAAPLIAASIDGQQPAADESLANTLAAAYRLIDPRGRRGLSERVSLLQSDTPSVSVPVWWNVASTAGAEAEQRDAAVVVSEAPPVAPEFTAAQTDRLAVSWIREVEQKNRRIRRYGMCAAGGVALISTVLWLAFRPTRSQPANQPTAMSAGVAVDAVDSELLDSDLLSGGLSAESTESKAPARAADLSVEQTDSTRPDDVPADSPAEEFAAPPVSVAPSPTDEAMELPAVSNESTPFDVSRFAPRDETEDVYTDSVPSDSNEGDGEDLMLVEQPAGVSAGVEQRTTVTPEETDESGGAPTVDANAAPELPTDDPATDLAVETDVDQTRPQAEQARAAQPDESALAAAQRSLATIAKDEPSGLDEVRLVKLAEASAPASADRYLLLSRAIDEAVMAGSPERASDYIGRLQAEFDVVAAVLQCACLERIAAEAKALTERERVVQWALIASDSAMREGRLEQADDAIRAGTIAAARLPDASLKLRLRQRRDAIDIAKRLSIRAERTLEAGEVESADRREALAAGRYFCFYRRDWETGLPWLARSADAAIAEAAQLDLKQQDRHAAGLRWMEVAAEESGHEADAMRARARDCLVEAQGGGAGLAAAAIAKQIAELEQQLPVEWRHTASEPVEKQAEPPADFATAGMVGRLTVAGSSSIAIVRYSPPQLLAADRWKGIVATWRNANGPIKLEMLGVVTLSRATTLSLTSLPSGRLGISSVSVGGRTVPLDRQAGAGQIDVPAGKHVVSWSIVMNQPVDSQLIVRDDRSGRAVPLTVTPAMVERTSAP